MKIVFLAGNLTDGGAQRVISTVASELSEMGNDVSILVFSRNKKEYPLSNGVQLFSISPNYEEYSKIGLVRRIRLIRKFIVEKKPDIAVGFLEGGYGLYLSSFGLNLKKVSSVRIDPVQIFDKPTSIRSFINQRWFYASDATVVQTDSQLDRLPDRIRRKSKVIQNPVSNAAFEFKHEALSEKCHRIIMVGRLAKQKNYPMAFDAIKSVIKKYPDVRLDVYGKGPEEENLRLLITNMGLINNVTLCGWTQDSIGEYNKHDIFIMTSNFEGLPNALMEAMAVGLPCIATDCPTGPSDLIENGKNGFLVPVDDSNGLSDRLIELIEMPADQRAIIGREARNEILEKYSSAVIANKWETFFTELLAKN